jgi:23S rRNA (cytidine1920-2'-O)/16S rRNA (cytidine1409-2'-O)-methyltransferase
MKIRLDNLLVKKKLVETRSQAENYIRLGKVLVGGVKQSKPGFFVREDAEIKILQENQYVSRAGMKLESVSKILGLNFKNKVVLDVGSSTGGFTDFALRNGASKVIAVDVGTDQLHPKLRIDERVELHEKTDIRDFRTEQKIDTVVIDVSFISLREILPSVVKIAPSAIWRNNLYKN